MAIAMTRDIKRHVWWSWRLPRAAALISTVLRESFCCCCTSCCGCFEFNRCSCTRPTTISLSSQASQPTIWLPGNARRWAVNLAVFSSFFSTCKITQLSFSALFISHVTASYFYYLFLSSILSPLCASIWLRLHTSRGYDYSYFDVTWW